MAMMIDHRFRGPATSGNGGYTCGLVAALAGNPAEVTLRVPPPLDVPLRIDGTTVWSGATLVAEAAAASVDVVPPEPVSFEEAVGAAEPDLATPFPECFVCGHKRADGLRIFAGRVPGRDVVAAPWIPRAAECAPEFIWAALDCPGAYATGVPGRGTVVLGRLAARVERLPHAGERCVVLGWSLADDGRKHFAGTALYGEAGDLVGVARAVWIEPR